MHPTYETVKDVVLPMMKAYEAGTLESFVPSSAGSQIIGGASGALDHEKNAFFDQEYIPKTALTGWNAKAADDAIRKENMEYPPWRDKRGVAAKQTGVGGGPETYAIFKGNEPREPYFRGYPARTDPLGPQNYENGVAGKLLTGSFIAGPHRWEGGYLRYGEAAWRNFLRAYTYLEDIPHGQLLQRMSVETIKSVNRLATTPEPGATASIFRGLGNLFRGEPAKPGELRNGKQVSRFETFSPTEVETIEKAGITVHSIPLPTGNVQGWLEYPAADQVPARLEKLVDNLKHNLGTDTPDVEGAVAQFQKGLVALHPFGDGNGRTSRLVANRVLEEFNLPPVIFENQDKDLVSTDEQWRTEVARGIERSKNIINATKDTGRYAWDEYARPAVASYAANGPEPTRKSMDHRITIDGLPFDLGKDGLLYSPTGRPHIVLGNEVIPMGQLDFYVMARRLNSMTTENHHKFLDAVTSETRKAYAKADSGMVADVPLIVASETAAAAADMNFATRPHPKLAALLTTITNPELADPNLLLTRYGLSNTSLPTDTISQYTQRDLEYKMLYDGLSANGLNEHAETVMAQRRTLFDIAKKKLTRAIEKLTPTPESPQGFTYHYERMMYEYSPLRHATLDEAIAKDGDEDIIVFRGAYAIEGLVGMAPNNDPRQPSAREVSEFRAEKGAVPNLNRSLQQITSGAVGSEMICITTDLRLLHGAFADQTKQHDISLASLPGFLTKGVMMLVGDELKIDSFGKIEAPIIKVKPVKQDPSLLDVELKRAVFVLKVPKKDLIPAHNTIGTRSAYNTEQEVEGLNKFGYGQVITAFPRAKLGLISSPEKKPAP
jgi:hypothetical protein